jgi:hypothetical protein
VCFLFPADAHAPVASLLGAGASLVRFHVLHLLAMHLVIRCWWFGFVCVLLLFPEVFFFYQFSSGYALVFLSATLLQGRHHRFLPPTLPPLEGKRGKYLMQSLILVQACNQAIWCIRSRSNDDCYFIFNPFHLKHSTYFTFNPFHMKPLDLDWMLWIV